MQATPLSYPQLHLSEIVVGVHLQGVAASNFSVPRTPAYAFKDELHALELVRHQSERMKETKARKESWLKTRAEQRRQREINALKEMEAKQKQKLETIQRQKAAEAEKKRLEELQRQEQIRQEAQRERERKAQEERKRLNLWGNAQLDVCGRLLLPNEVKQVKNFQSLCGITDDPKSIRLLMLCKWDMNAAVDGLFRAHDIDAAIAALEPKPVVSTPKTWISIVMMNGSRLSHQFEVTDTLWALYAYVAENVGNNRFSLYNGNTNLTANESCLSQTFSQTGLVNPLAPSVVHVRSI